MILPIEIYGSSVLRKKSEDITKDYPDLNKFIDDMYETMYHCDGLGLAASQVGKNVRIITVDLSPAAEDENQLKDYKKVFINPVIADLRGEPFLFSEGCLSIPGIREDVLRPEEIDIEYLNENFETVKETLKGLPARVLQHEYDHLEGILFVDRLAILKKKLINRKLQAIARGKVSAGYKTKLSR